MLEESAERINQLLASTDLVLDIGGWANPFLRADWVIDLMPYKTRGLYGDLQPELERFSEQTWVQRDICDREPWPFDDAQFDFAVCSHTLEDIRDPIWVAAEISRVAKAGYVEVPARLEEQSWGVHGPWVGWSHHHWLIDHAEAELEFIFKSHVLAGRHEFHFPPGFAATLDERERVHSLFWEGQLKCGERIFLTAEELDGYLACFVAEHLRLRRWRLPRRSLLARARARIADLR